MKETPASHGHVAALVGAAVLAPVVVRLTRILDHGLRLTFADCKGVVADLGVSLLLAAEVEGL